MKNTREKREKEFKRIEKIFYRFSLNKLSKRKKNSYCMSEVVIGGNVVIFAGISDEFGQGFNVSDLTFKKFSIR